MLKILLEHVVLLDNRPPAHKAFCFFFFFFFSDR